MSVTLTNNYSNMKRKEEFFARPGILLLSLLVLSGLGLADLDKLDTRPDTGEVPKELFRNVKDYGFMWWEDGIPNTSNYVFNMRTSHYALSFDYTNLQLKKMGIVSSHLDETEALRATEAECFDGALPTVFAAVLEAGAKRYKVTGGKVLDGRHPLDKCQLIEAGKYFNRRFLNDLTFEPGAPSQNEFNSGIEIASWPDRLLFLFRSVPTEAVVQGMLEMSLDLDDKFSIELTEGGGHALLAEDGTGYVLLPTPGSSLSIEASGAKVTVRSPRQNWSAGSENTTGLIVYPVSSDVHSKLLGAVDAEEGVPMITANQLEPSRKTLNVEYDYSYGYYNIDVFNEGSGNDRFDRSQIEFNNTAAQERLIRIRFEKEKRNAKATGQVLMLRDEEGNPLGIPVQISKNWHSNKEPLRYCDQWMRGLTMLTVPANSRITIELVTANAHWGKVPAASTAQLCLVGWGGNQQWNQSAIGNWGENLCYATDQSLVEASLTDMRGMYSNPGTSWGGNVGGADFFRYYLDAENLMGRKGMRSHYRRYSPNMTEVTYASRSRDNDIDQEFTAIEYRSDDMTRGILKIRMDVRRDINFADFVFFQMGSDHYQIGDSDKLFVGNENGLVKEWVATKGGHTYHTPKIEATGRLPWFSYQDTHNDYIRNLTSTNRGLVIRSWKARINGIDKVPPYWAEFGVNTGGPNPQQSRKFRATSVINIVPPPDVKGFKAGDYLEAELEVILIPKKAEEYFGPNNNLKRALATDANTWKMVQREVLGNDISVDMFKGELQKNYPIQIKVTEGNVAQFKVTGGIAYVPFTFTGVNGYRDPLLEKKVNGSWEKIDQSNYGKDFWQADFYQDSWDITYTVNLDSPEDARLAREFRFSMNKN
jgi:hypothetical protein